MWIQDLLTNNGIINIEYYARILISGFMGLLIGLDRTRRSKPAGLKTYCLLAIGSCLITIISIMAAHAFSIPGRTTMDPMRLVAQLLPAVGFVGAGTIWRLENKVKGLTSAAFVFFACAIGIGIGSGFYGITIFTFILTFFYLRFSVYLEEHKFNTQDDEHID